MFICRVLRRTACKEAGADGIAEACHRIREYFHRSGSPRELLYADIAGALLARGFIVSLGGGTRDCLVLTPPLNVARPLLDAFAQTLLDLVGPGAQ